MYRLRTPMLFWALMGVCSLCLVETLFFLFPGQAAENHLDSNTPITIKFSCAKGSGLLRLDIPRDADPKLVQSINLRSDVKMWMPRGAVVHYEEPEEQDGTTPR
jgi:hypothetical protein